VGQRLGQHFLNKGSILERIAAAACPEMTDLVIEIGPGRGALTERLLKRARRVIAIELDYDLVQHLHGKFGSDPRLEVIQSDVLATDLAQWGPAPIVGNLPYYITSPILEKTGRLRPPRSVFLMQKEVAERLIATPGNREYGFLTVQTAVFANARMLFEVKPSAFNPPPKVDSAVVLLEPRDTVVDDPDGFIEFVGKCFRQKRKTIRNNLAGSYAVDGWPEAGLRGEQIPLEQFVDMYRRAREL
jgi:16S rRNA (adenine1518-N6/adenine1519-N6)-dimethyltransferase